MAKTAKQRFELLKQPYLDAYKVANGKETTVEFNNGWVYIGEVIQGEGYRVGVLEMMTKNLLKRIEDEKNQFRIPSTVRINITPRVVKDEDTVYVEKYNLFIKDTLIAILYKPLNVDYIVRNVTMRPIIGELDYVENIKTEEEAFKILFSVAEKYIKRLAD